MSDRTNLSGKFLGQLTLIQSLVMHMPDKENMLRFICRGLQDFDSVKEVDYVLYEDQKSTETAFKKNGSKQKVFHVEKDNSTFAFLVVHLSDEHKFSPYIPFIENFCNMLAVIFEERKQKQRNEELTANLELLVAERTKKLKASNLQLQATEQQLRANNQQLQATEQQLRAANQQLNANNQQLLATEQQLRAVNQQLSASESKFRSYVENAPDGIFIVNKSGKYVEVNKAACKLTGYSKDELLDLTIPDLVQEEYLEKAENHFQTLMKEGFASDEIGYLTKQGEKRFWNVDAIKLSETRFMGFIKDITESRNAKKALKRGNDYLQSIFKAAPVGIGTVTNRRLNTVNERMCEMVGYTKDELVGKEASILYPSKSEFDYVGKEKYRQISTYGTGTVETRFKRKDGSVIDVLLSSTPIDPEKPTENVTFSALDITEKNRTNQQLKEALEKAQESDRLKSAFLANMSHEIRTPMNGILGFTSLIKKPNLSGDKRDSYIQVIENSGHRLLDTINDIIDISKIEAGQVEVVKTEVSVNKILDEQYNFFQYEAKTKGLTLIYKPILSNKESCCVTDKHKLEGVLINLIKNAIKYTEKGQIEMVCLLKENAGRKFLEFNVKDTGIGISPDRIDRIFNRFEQADIEDKRAFEGSGLGLTITKSYLEMLGGDIHVASEKGSGSTFTFSIPYITQ